MPRNGASVFYNLPGTEGFPDTTIESEKYNNYIADIAQDLNLPRPIVAGGIGTSSLLYASMNLRFDTAYQLISNFDANTLLPGTFYCAANATGAPNTHAFAGIIYNSDPPVTEPAPATQQNIVVEARDLSDSTQVYVRQKTSGVWGAWFQQGTVINSPPGTPANITINGPSGQPSQITGTTNGVLRWLIQLGNGSAESGTATGNDFYIHRYNNDGSYGGSPFGINRATGLVGIQNDLTVSGALTATGDIWANSGTIRFRSNAGIYLTNDGSTFSFSQTTTAPQFTAGTLALNGTNHATTDGTNYFIRSNGVEYFQRLDGYTRGYFNDSGLSVTGNANVSGTVVSAAVSCSGQVYGSSLLSTNGNATIRTPAGGGVFLQDTSGNAKAGFFWNADGTAAFWNQLSTTSVTLPNDGKVKLSNGIQSKSGFNGGYGTVCYNLNWEGGVGWHLYADDLHQGIIAYTSDYRLKKDIRPLPRTWDIVRSLRPISYSQAEWGPKPINYPNERPLFWANDDEQWGFVAHELQEKMVKTAATGFKDAPDIVQSPNPWTVIAALTKTIQEMQDRIEALENG